MSPVIRQLVSLRLVLFCFSSLISLVGLSQPSISIVSGHPSSDCEEINTKIEINYDNAACIETSWRCSFTENGFETGDDFWCGNVTGSGSNGYITEPVDFKVRHALAPFVSGVKTTSTGEYWIRVEQDCHPNPTVYSEKIKLEIGPTLPSFDFSWSSKIICSGESFSNDLLNVTAATEYDWTAEVVGGSFDEVADGNIGTFSGLSFSESLTNSSNVDGHIKYTFTPKNAYCYNTSGDQVFDVYVDAPLATGTVSLVPYMSYYCEESTFDLEVDGASSDYEIIYQKDSDDADTWHDYAGVLSGITAGFFGETTKFKVRVGSDCENQEYSAEVTMNYQAKPTFDAPNSPDNTITLSRCSSVSVDYQVQTDVSADLSWTVTDNSGFVSGYSTGPSLTNVDSYTIDDVLVNSSDEVQSITYEFTAVKNGCSSSVAKVIVDVQPENKAGTLSVLTPTLCQSAQSQTVTLELDGREGADVDLYIKNPGEASFVFTDWPLGDPTTATWDVFGVSPDNEELTYEFKVKSEATSCITPEDLESNVVTVVLKPVPVLTITAEDGDQNSISSGAVLCHGDEISISPSSNVIGTWFSWSRTVTGGTSNLENDSGVDTNLSINETVHNYGSTDVAVVYTITPIVDPDGANCSGSSQTFEFAIKPNYIAPSGLTATPAITCVSGDVVLNLANPGFGDIVWKRVSYAVRNNAQNSTKPLNEITSFNVVQPDVGNPQQLTINNIFESAYYWVELDVGEGTCIPSEYTSALAALIPEPAEIVGDLKHYNGESGQEPILCWNSSFNQTLPRNNDQATYTWVASVFTFGEGSDAPYAGDPNNIYFSPQGVIGSGIHAIADNVINRNTYPIKIKYSLTPYLSHGGVADQCSGEVKTFEVIVSPLGNAGEFILPVAEVCRDDDFEPSVPDFYVENTSGPYEVQFYPFGAGDWQTWNPLNPVELNENTLFRVKSLTQEIYGCTPETEYSEIVEFRIGIPDDLTDQPPSTQFLPFCGFASLVKIDIPLLGPDAEDWYWQTVVDGRDHSDNSLAKTYQEGETAFIQEYVDGCWGNSHAVNFETLPVPNLINPQDQFRFGTGQVVLSATSDIPSTYEWFEPGESTPFEGEMESQFASAEIKEEEMLTYEVRAKSQMGCMSDLASLSARCYPYPQLLLGDGGSILEPTVPMLLMLAAPYNDPAYISQINAEGVTVTWLLDHQPYEPLVDSLPFSHEGLYQYQVTLPNGKQYTTPGVRRRNWINEPNDVPVAEETGIPPAENLIAPQLNYVRTYTTRQKTTDQAVFDMATPSADMMVETSYSDGLGRGIQSVSRGSSPGGFDFVQPTAFDELGRSPNQYLAYTTALENESTGTYRPNALLEQYEYYSQPGGNLPTSTYPYARMRYEDSPLNRVLESAKPGEVYLPGNDWTNVDRKTSSAYTRSNREELDSAIHHYYLDGKTVKYQSNDDYPDHSLAVSVSVDEMGKEYTEYTNKRGQLVQSRIRDSDGAWVLTNYIYDDFGNLRVIMTPEALNKMQSPEDYQFIEDENAMALNFDKELYSYQHVDYYYIEGVRVTLKEPFRVSSYTDDLGPDDRFFISKSETGAQGKLVTSLNIHEQLFIYEYDERQQLTASKSPGADWQYFVYDKWGRQIMSQGPHMRLADSLWSFTKFDDQSRPILSGVIELNGLSLEDIRSQARAATAKHEDWTGTGTIGYTINNSYPSITESDLRSVLYYDNYNFPGASGYPYVTYTANNGNLRTTGEKSNDVIGLSTGGKLRLLDGNGTWLTSVSYYNDDYELIQSVGDNHLGAKDRSLTWYNYTGSVNTEVTLYNEGITNGAANTPQQVEITRSYTYDHRDRLLSVNHQIDDNEVVTLTSFEYNELGETIRKDLHATASQPLALQQLDYSYDIRGALTTVNNPDNPNDGQGGLPDVFGMGLSFEHGFDQGHFNGQLSGMSWFNRSALELTPTVNHFGYQYDDMGRMSLADYTSTDVDDFTVRVDRYDQNGNILKLTRQGKSGDMDGKIDDLYYVYDGDRIRKVSDLSQQDEGYADGADDEEELHYDIAGNLVGEENKGIQQITYNDLNKPIRITLDNGDYLSYTYDAAGMKLTSSVYVGGALVDSTIYHGELQYQANATDVRLGQIFHEEGRIVENIIDHPVTSPVQPHGWNKLDYQYYLTDHLGNIRSILSSDMDRIQVFRATMEDDELATEQQYFENLDMRTSNSAYDYTRIRTNDNTYTHAAPLDGVNDVIGPAFTYRVQAGDQITMEAWAEYAGSYSNAQGGALSTALTDAFWIDNSLGELVNVANPFGPIASALDVVAGSNTASPKAFLTYIFLDENFKFVNMEGEGYGFDQVTSSAQGQHEQLGISRIFDQNGYLFVYVSNQGAGTTIYFDELTITVDMSPIDQAQDYYPFGLTFNGHTYSQDLEDLNVESVSETTELIHETFDDNTTHQFVKVSGHLSYRSGDQRIRMKSNNNTQVIGETKRTINTTPGSDLYIQFTAHRQRGSTQVFLDDLLLDELTSDGAYAYTVQPQSNSVDLIFRTVGYESIPGSSVRTEIDDFIVAETVTHTPEVLGSGSSNRSVAAYLGHTRFLSEPNKRFYQGKEAQELIDLYDFHARLYDAGLGRFTGIDPAGQFNSPYAGMGNNPVMGVDPDGELAWFVPVIIGAVLNVGVNAAQGNIDNFWQGLGYAAIGGASGLAGFGAGQAVAGAVGTVGFAGGALTGAAGGFAGGFVGGAGNAWAGGASFSDGLGAGFTSAGYGALTGGVIGGVSGGIQAVKHGGNFWSGKGATFANTVSAGAPESVEVGEGLEYSNEYAQKFSDNNFGEVTGLNELHADNTLHPLSKYQVDGDYFVSGTTRANAVTTYLGTGKGSNVYFAKAAFSSAEQLYLTMGHEYLHVGFYHGGFDSFKRQHATIAKWEYDQSKLWNFRVNHYTNRLNSYKGFPTYNLQSNPNWFPPMNTLPWPIGY